ncbi:MAG TPA: tetratricopeptide repeat protein, partial [Herpetosiphonaceae bacterium]|nr:tetratricopeptide repeat protein [Herpetosiphonaceae bacterium]
CYNVRKPAQERISGCYGDYVRVYLPPNAAPLELIGADSALEPGREDGLAVAGFYLLLYPGQTRTVTLRYRPQLAAPPPYRLLVQKQAGTLARPFALRVRSASGASVSAQADLWHDIELRLSDGGAFALAGAPPPLHPANTQQRLATQTEWAAGWRMWQAGDQAAAVSHWQASGTISAALDQVVALRWQDDLDGAGRLLAALQPATANHGRAAFLAGQLAELRGDTAAAQTAYLQALALSPESQVARFALGLSQHSQGDEDAALTTLRGMADPIQALHRREFDQRYARDYAAADRTNRLILAMDPINRAAWENRYWMLRFSADRVEWPDIVALATDALAALPEQERWVGRRAEAYQNLGENEAALRDWQQTTALSPTNTVAWYQLGVLHRATNDLEQARLAFEQAARLDNQQHVEYYTLLADTYERLALRDEAIAAYRIAARLAPDNEGIRQALARLEGS